MKVVELRIEQLRDASWNPNAMDEPMRGRLRQSIEGFGMVENLVARPIGDGTYEVLSGNQRIQVMREIGLSVAPCVIVDLDDSRARLLAQVLNRVQGEDDLGLRTELVRDVLATLPKEDVLALLPESSESLKSLCSLGQQTMAEYLETWQQAQGARLKHLQFQLTSVQLEVVEEALVRLIPEAKLVGSDNPNQRGTALHLLCKKFWDLEGGSL